MVGIEEGGQPHKGADMNRLQVFIYGMTFGAFIVLVIWAISDIRRNRKMDRGE